MSSHHSVHERLSYLLGILLTPSWLLILTHHTDELKVRSWVNSSIEPDEASVQRINQLYGIAKTLEGQLRQSNSSDSQLKAQLLRALVIEAADDDNRTVIELIADNDIEIAHRHIGSAN